MRRSLGLLVTLATLLAPVAVVGLPPALERAKDEGVVGEQVDGYLGFPKGSAPAELARLVDEVNAKRRESYADVARKTGSDGTKVATVAGAKLVEREKPGRWVRLATGWVRR